MVDASAGTRLRIVRETLGLSQRDLATELGVAPSALAQWEVGSRALPGPITRLLTLYEEQLRIRPPPETKKRRRQRGAFRESWIARTASTAYAGALWAILRKNDDREGATSFERSVRSAAADHYLRTLGELKGLSMKLGQMLANVDTLDPSLAREGRAPLTVRALSAKPMPRHALLEIFLRELGKTPRALFRDWSSDPLFAASIGQVHRAVLHGGEEVAVKVQYPEVVATLESDLRNVELLDRLFCVLSPSQEPGVFFDEIRTRILEECDYHREAEHTRAFARFFADRDDVRIPTVFDALSTGRILTTSFVSGQSFDDFIAAATPASRDRAGRAIWDFFYGPAQAEGFFHADPHPGNLLFHRDAVTFLDFGRLGRMSKSFLECWYLLVRAVLENDRARVLELLDRMGLARIPSVETGDALYRLTLANHLPWLAAGPFTFTAKFAHAAWKQYETAAVRSHLKVPRDSVLWSQLTFGVFALLVRLGASVDCRKFMLDSVYRPGEKRPAPYTREELARLGVEA